MGYAMDIDAEEGIVCTTEALYDGSMRWLFFNNRSSVELFPITVDVLKGLIFILVLFNIYLQTNHAGYPLGLSHLRVDRFNNLRFADDIGLAAGSNSELQTVADKLATSAEPKEWRSAPRKLVTMKTTGSSKAEVRINGVQLKQVQSFKDQPEWFEFLRYW